MDYATRRFALTRAESALFSCCAALGRCRFFLVFLLASVFAFHASATVTAEAKIGGGVNIPITSPAAAVPYIFQFIEVCYQGNCDGPPPTAQFDITDIQSGQVIGNVVGQGNTTASGTLQALGNFNIYIDRYGGNANSPELQIVMNFQFPDGSICPVLPSPPDQNPTLNLENNSYAFSCTNAALSVSTAHLQDAVIDNTGSSQQQTLLATGGTPPYQWALQGLPQDLPAGLAIYTNSGVLQVVAQIAQQEGRPVTPGTYTVTIDVQDSSATTQYASAALSLNIVCGVSGGCSTTQPYKSTGNPSDISGCACVADPIALGTGNVFEEVDDYATAGPNPLTFKRYYNSMAAPTLATALGQNWRSNYDRYLNVVSSSEIIAERPDGQQLIFTFNGSAWTSDTDVDYVLANPSGSTWTLTDHDDTAETYTVSGSKGVLQSIAYRNGYTQTLNYSGSQLSSVNDYYNRTLSFTYTGGQISGVTTPDSLVLSYGYTLVNNEFLLTSVGYNTSPATSQTYVYGNASFPFALTGITDELGNSYASWAYDGQGRATSNQLAGGANYTQVSYDDTTGNRTVTGPLGIAETYKFTTLQGVPKVTEIDRVANGSIPAATRTMSYDSNGYLATATDWNGNETQYTNNGHGQPTAIIEADGVSGVQRETDIAYDTTWVHEPATITTPGLTTSFTYDSHGNVSTKLLTDTTSSAGTYTAASRTTTYTWNGSGQLLTVQLPRTDVTAQTTFAYTGGTLTSTTDALSHVTTINTSTGGGRPLTMHDPNGVLTTMTYDTRQRMLTSVLTTGAGNLNTINVYDAAGNLTKRTLPDMSYVTWAYDAAHRVTATGQRVGYSAALTLDAMGDVTQSLWKNGSGTTEHEHTATFDALGRKLTDVGGASQTTSYSYDSNGNITGITDPLSNASSQAFDALNRLTTFTDALTHSASTTYDAYDRPLTVTDTKGHATTYTYDGFGDVVQRASPDTGTDTYYYL